MNKVIGFVVGAGMLVLPSIAAASVSITLSGGSIVVPQGQIFNEPGYSAFSTFDGDVTGSVGVSGANTSRPGNYSISYSVTDSNFDSAVAYRDLTVIGNASGAMLYCSGPLAPGWVVGTNGGGCGGTGMVISAGQTLGDFTCPFYSVSGCLVK